MLWGSALGFPRDCQGTGCTAAPVISAASESVENSHTLLHNPHILLQFLSESGIETCSNRYPVLSFAAHSSASPQELLRYGRGYWNVIMWDFH